MYTIQTECKKRSVWQDDDERYYHCSCESMLHLIALVQGGNIVYWRVERKSDLAECFTNIRLGKSTIDYAKLSLNPCPVSFLHLPLL